MADQNNNVFFGSEEDNNPYIADSVMLTRERRGNSVASENSPGLGLEGKMGQRKPSESAVDKHSIFHDEMAQPGHFIAPTPDFAPAFDPLGAALPDDQPNGDEHGSDNESLLLYQNPSVDSPSDLSRINRAGRVYQILAAREKPTILISEAGKSNEGLANASKRYITYTIKVVSGDSSNDEIQTRRRYSDFESLRDILTRIFPLLMIPPIPPKNYFSLNIFSGLVNSSSLASSTAKLVNSTDSDGATENPKAASSSRKPYPYINSNHLSKYRLVEHRKRLLANFLNNCLSIPRIRRLDFFAKFLDPAANWSDEISLISSQLPKSIYQSNPEDALSTDPLYACLPLPVTGPALNLPFQNPLRNKKSSKSVTASDSPVQNVPPSTVSDEASASSAQDLDITQKHSSEYSIIKNSQLDDINKRIIDNLLGLSSDYGDLGAALNLLSSSLSDTTTESRGAVNESKMALGQALDEISSAYESTSLTVNRLIGDLETKYSEPLGEAFKFSYVYESTKTFRKRKEKQSRLVDQELKEKKRELAESIRTEIEVNKIENGIQSQSLKRSSSYSLPQKPHTLSTNGQSSGFGGKFLPSFNAVKKISKYVSDIMDQNPELTRKQKLAQLQERVSLLEKCQQIVLQDVAYISNELENNAKQFKRNELKTIINILLNYNRIFSSWARANMEIWGEAREVLNRIL